VQHTTPIPQPGPLFSQVAMAYSSPLTHITQQDHGPDYHKESMVAYDRIDGLKKKLDGLQLDLKALRMKDTFGKNDFEFYLVPNVVIPPKLKVPNFEKYKGNTCPMVHLEMYVRKMFSYVDNDELLIHCFQDSLTGAAILWYMGLEKADIKTFHDLRKAFIQRYNYNLYLPPYGDELRTMTQNDNVQLWRDCAAQVPPPRKR